MSMSKETIVFMICPHVEITVYVAIYDWLHIHTHTHTHTHTHSHSSNIAVLTEIFGFHSYAKVAADNTLSCWFTFIFGRRNSRKIFCQLGTLHCMEYFTNKLSV